jgi:hypothetical protein
LYVSSAVYPLAKHENCLESWLKGLAAAKRFSVMLSVNYALFPVPAI